MADRRWSWPRTGPTFAGDEPASTACACSAGNPWICRTISRIFLRRHRDVFGNRRKLPCAILCLRLGRVGAVFLERVRGQREFAELVADHVFRHKHRIENLAVMHGERKPHEIGRYGRTPRPSLDRRFLIR